MSDRDRILNRLGVEDLGSYPESRDFTHPVVGELWQEFKDQLESLGGRFGGTELLGELEGHKIWVESAAEQTNIQVPGQRHDDLWTAEIGVTVADLAVASTGSIVVSAGPERSRLASLVPPIHIALIASSKIVSSLHAAFELGMPERISAIITGPSRTADIEGVLVRGIHGPKELWVVRLDD